MDDSFKLFKDYFRDIYSATTGTCAGECDDATPASLGPVAYEFRRCCKAACSEEGVQSLSQCRDTFCSARCAAEALVSDRKTILDDCIGVCQVGCEKRFSDLQTKK